MERKLRDTLPNGQFGPVDPRHRRLMQRVRGSQNRTTEARLRAALAGAGISGWRLNARSIRGSPDIYFPVERLAIFLDGCFWHGCRVCGHVPDKNSAFWTAKIARNRERDSIVSGSLRRCGVSVVRFWEHDVSQSLGGCVRSVCDRLMERRRAVHRKRPGV